MQFDTGLLKPGDTMLYFNRKSVVDWCIAVKTSFYCAHVELYDGNGQSVASRNGIGVNRFPMRLEGLIAVRRPLLPINWNAGQDWFNEVARFQKYDFIGLLAFWLAVERDSKNRMFCSEFWLRRYRASFFQPLNPDQDADRTSPGLCWTTGSMSSIWESGAVV